MAQIYDIRNYKDSSQSFKALNFGTENTPKNLGHNWHFIYIQNLLFKTSTIKKYSELHPWELFEIKNRADLKNEKGWFFLEIARHRSYAF